jgi:predicted lysophospholipase L1 biosynthesis ABC-type transport system permease subunit
MNSEDKRMVYFTPQDAYRLGIGYIKRRLQRTAINIASIALANSFFTSLILTDMFYSIYNEFQGGSIAVDANQYWLVAVALMVSVVGITNAMLISVYERYREIGTMKCIGATDQHIMMLFLVESIIQGAVGGVVGFLFGLFTAILSSGFTTGFDIILKIRALYLLSYLLGTTILSITLSIIASIYPAWRASILPPVEALSYEL